MSDYPFWPLNKQKLPRDYIPKLQLTKTSQQFGNYHKKSFSSRNLPNRTKNLRQSLYEQEQFVRPFNKRQFLTQRENKFEPNDNFQLYEQQRYNNLNLDWIEFGRQNTISNRRQQSQNLQKESQLNQGNQYSQTYIRQQRIELDILRKDKEIQQIEIDQLQKRLRNRDKSLGKLNKQYYDLRDVLQEQENEIKFLRNKFYESENQNKILLLKNDNFKQQFTNPNLSEYSKKNFCESMYKKYLSKSQKSEEKINIDNVQLQEVYNNIQQHLKNRKIIKIAEQKELLKKIKQIQIDKSSTSKIDVNESNLKINQLQEEIKILRQQIEQKKKDRSDQKLFEVNQKLLEIIDHFKIWEEEDEQNLSDNMEKMNLQLVNIIYNQVMSGDNSSQLSKSKQPSFQIDSMEQNDNIQVTEEEYNKLDQIFNEDNETELEQELQIKNNQVQDLKEALLQQSEQIEDLQEEKKIQEEEIENLNSEIETLNQRVQETQDQLKDQIYLEEQIKELQVQLKKLEDENQMINFLQEEIQEKEKTQKKFDQICIDNAKTINDLYEQLDIQKNKNIQLEKQIINKNYINQSNDNNFENDSQFIQNKKIGLDITSRSLDNFQINKELSLSGNYYCFSQFNANHEIDDENSILADKYLQILVQKVYQRQQEIKQLQNEIDIKDKDYKKKLSDLENQKINNQKLKIQIYQMEQLKEENIQIKKRNQQLFQELERIKKEQNDSDSEKFTVDDDGESQSVIYERKSQIVQEKPQDYTDSNYEPYIILQQNIDELQQNIDQYLNKISQEQDRDIHPLKEMRIKLEQYSLLYKDHKQKYEKRIGVIKNQIEKLNIIKKVETMNLKLKEQQERNQDRIKKLRNKLDQLQTNSQEDEIETMIFKYQRDLQALEKEQNDYANNIVQLEDYLQENKTGQDIDEVERKNQKLTEEFNRDVNVLLKLVKKLKDEFSNFNQQVIEQIQQYFNQTN